MSKEMEYVELSCHGVLGEGCRVVGMCKIDLTAVKPGKENRVREIALKRTMERLKFEHTNGYHLVKQESRDF